MMRLIGTHTRLGDEYAVCVGAFDGLHVGHRALLAVARQQAPKVAIVSFEPHPLAVLAPDRAPPRLQTPRQKARVASYLGVDALVLLPFDTQLAATTPADFASVHLARALAPRTVVVGPDFRYGARRAGTVTTLRDDLAREGVRTHVAELLATASGDKLGSTGIRKALADGDVNSANDALARVHAVEGRVVQGAGRGRTLGFRTANVRSEGAMLPRDGVYACWLQVTDPASSMFGTRWPATASLGSNPTFADGHTTTTGLEVHVHDVDLGECLYGVRVEVGFVARLRDTTSFDGVQALLAQIERDVATSASLLAALDVDLDRSHATDSTSAKFSADAAGRRWAMVPPRGRDEEAAFDTFAAAVPGVAQARDAQAADRRPSSPPSSPMDEANGETTGETSPGTTRGVGTR